MGELHDAIVKLIFLVTFRQGFMGPLMNILEVQITLLAETHIRCYLGHRYTGCFKKSPSSPGNEAELPAAKARAGGKRGSRDGGDEYPVSLRAQSSGQPLLLLKQLPSSQPDLVCKH